MNMKPSLIAAVVLMLGGAVMLFTDVASAGLWIAVITVGIALVAIAQAGNRRA